jgi:Ca-activated chloride channel family protein
VLILVLGIVALAGPRWPDERTRLRTEGIGLMLLVDVSGSMAERDFTWDGVPVSRLEAVQRVFRLLLVGGQTSNGASFTGRPTDLAGLIAFASRAELTCPPTLSHSVLVRDLETLRPQSDPRRAWTNITDAILLGLERLTALGDRRKVLVLLTDGVQTVDPAPSGWRTREAAQAAKSLGVAVYVIDAGGEVSSGEGRSAGTQADAKARREEAVFLMQEIARLSDGRYLRAGDTAGLLEACQTLDRFERKDITSFQYLRYHEAYPWLLLTAVALLVGLLTLERTRWRSLP